MIRVSALLARFRRILRSDDGFTLVELIVAMAMMLTIFTAITGAFASGLNARQRGTDRAQAQLDARQALALMREDLNCAYAVQAVGPRAPSLGFRLLPLPDRAVQHLPGGRLERKLRRLQGFSLLVHDPRRRPAGRLLALPREPARERLSNLDVRLVRDARGVRPRGSGRRMAHEQRCGDAVDLERQHLAELAHHLHIVPDQLPAHGRSRHGRQPRIRERIRAARTS